MSEPAKTEILPFLKWAGGKRWLYLKYREVFPETYERYIEPFMGGASTFFALSPNRALLTDISPQLVECYEQMRDNSDRLLKQMLQHHRLHSDEYYYEIRSKKMRSSVTRAAQFLYLNRTCWNGLYRVNLKGQFNVPRGTKNAVVFDGENFHLYASALTGTKLACCDFEETLMKAKRDDFVFVDPPYTVKHNCNGFKKYNEKIFSWNDQIRLRDAVARVGERGAKVLVCNANHEDILKLYADIGSKKIVHRNSAIAGEPEFRVTTSEVVVTVNYRPKKRLSPGKFNQLPLAF